jgi:O-methyltransferase
MSLTGRKPGCGGNKGTTKFGWGKMIEALKNFLRRTPLIKPYRWMRRIPTLRLVQGPLTYNQDGLATMHSCDFMQESLFKEAYKLGEATYTGSGSFIEGAKIHWRLHVLCWAAYHGRGLEGDFVECGVNRGWFSRTVMHYIDFKNLNKRFYLLDTFEGFSEPYLLAEEKMPGKIPGSLCYEDCYESVKKTFKEFPNVRIIKGPVPETLDQIDTDKICYLSIDMNCMAPEIAAAEFFWDKMVCGGVIVLDDYGFKGHYLQKHAFDDFASKRNVKVLSLPTGQGLIIKPC